LLRLRRTTIGLAAVLVSLALGATPATAAVQTGLAPDGTLVLIGDDGHNLFEPVCTGVSPSSELRFGITQNIEPTGGPIKCDSIERVSATLGDGRDTLILHQELFGAKVGSFFGVTVDAGPGNDLIGGMQGAPGTANGVTYIPDTTVNLGPGVDRFYGGLGADTVDGGPGLDFAHLSNGLNVFRGGPGTDIAVGGNDRDALFGQGGNDGFDGGLGDDLLVGGARNDILLGKGGRDRLRGGPGRNRLIQGGGRLRILEFFPKAPCDLGDGAC
jgi:Ca2+-binding RTX toxin-like protein